jgi:hypothetical protein
MSACRHMRQTSLNNQYNDILVRTANLLLNLESIRYPIRKQLDHLEGPLTARSRVVQIR